MNSRMIRFWDECHVPYQIIWTVMLVVITGPMWYLRSTKSDEPSNFFEGPNCKSVGVSVRLVWVVGHGRQHVTG